MREFHHGNPGLADRRRGDRPKRASNRQDRNGGAVAIHGLQPDRLRLYRHLLGSEIGPTEGGAGAGGFRRRVERAVGRFRAKWSPVRMKKRVKTRIESDGLL